MTPQIERLTPLSLGAAGGASPRDARRVSAHHGGVHHGHPTHGGSPGVSPSVGPAHHAHAGSAPTATPGGLHTFGSGAMAAHSAFDDLGAAHLLRDTWPLFEPTPTSPGGARGACDVGMPPGQ